MTGKETIKKYKIFINICEFFFNILPYFVLSFIYDVSSSYENKLAILYRYLYVKRFSKNSGENIFIGSRVILKNLPNMTFGNNISIHSGSYIDAAGEIQIDSNVSIASQVCIYSFNHTWNDTSLPIKYNPTKLDKIFIKEDVWIGTKAVILAGVNIESRTVIAAGSVVNKNITNNTLVAGVPAKIIKKI